MQKCTQSTWQYCDNSCKIARIAAIMLYCHHSCNIARLPVLPIYMPNPVLPQYCGNFAKNCCRNIQAIYCQKACISPRATSGNKFILQQYFDFAKWDHWFAKLSGNILPRYCSNSLWQYCGNIPVIMDFTCKNCLSIALLTIKNIVNWPLKMLF